MGFLALFGVSVQTGVIMVEYINQLRARRFSIEDAAVEGAVLRLRPIMMTMLVATLGLLPAALSHAIGSDSQRPFAIVIVGGLIAALADEHFSVADFICVDRGRTGHTSAGRRRVRNGGARGLKAGGVACPVGFAKIIWSRNLRPALDRAE